MDYRLYLLDEDRRTSAGHGFVAGTDSDARRVAWCIFDACDDAAHGYERWHRTKVIASDRDRGLADAVTLAAMTRDWRDVVCQYEEVMRDSFARVRDSVKMSATLATRIISGPEARGGRARSPSARLAHPSNGFKTAYSRAREKAGPEEWVSLPSHEQQRAVGEEMGSLDAAARQA
jgi:hypothetical protein